MFSTTGRRLFNSGFRNCRRFITNGDPRSSRKNNFGNFDDRTLGLLTLLVSVPTAAYIWKHHKSPKSSDFTSFKDLNENKNSEIIPKTRKRTVKYLIVGGGTAGFSAIQAIKETDPEAQITLVSKEPTVPYLRPPLSKELWFTASEKLALQPEKIKFSDWHGNEKPLAFENSNFYQNLGVEMILGCEAVDFDLGKRQVGLSDGQILQFDRLLIATGAQPKIIDATIDESIKEHVSTFRSVSDFVKLHNMVKEREGQKIVVVGGGFLGSELAVALAKIGNQLGHSVTQVFPEDGHMGLVFPKYLSQWTTEKVSQLGVKVKSGRSVSSISEGKNNSPVNVVLDNDEELPADHVIVAVGVEPCVAKPFKTSLPIDKELGGLEADRYLQVVPGVFAAGDVVSYLDPVLDCRRRTEHFDHAVLSGKLAGFNMANSLKPNGSLEPYSNQSMFWSDLGPEVGYEAVGLVDSSLTTVGVWARARPVESPQGTELDTSDIRVQPIGQTSISTAEPKFLPNENGDEDSQLTSAGPSEVESELSKNVPEIKSETSITAEISPTYGKGVVFYFKDRKIVGILLFNLFNRVNLAKEVLKEGLGVDDISKYSRLFNVEEVA